MILGLTFSLSAQESSKKIVFFISPPRSMSAACARMMNARGDFEVFHEPFHLAYCSKFHPDYTAAAFGPGRFTTYENVKQKIFAAAKNKPVFVKEVSFDVEDFLLNDPDFVKNKNVHFVFLLRDPHSSIMSFYRKSQGCPPHLNYLIGYEPFYNIFQKVKKESANRLTAVFADDLSTNPEETVKKLCHALEMPFIPESLSWSSSEESFDCQKEWHEDKTNETIQVWHGDALNSSGFAKLAKYSVDENGKPTFEEIVNPEHKQQYQECYLYNLKFYEMLLNDFDFQEVCI